MKVTLPQFRLLGSRRAAFSGGNRGLTLPETMITLVIFGMVIFGVMQLHMFGARQDQVVARKLGASDQSRINFQRMTGEIRSAKNLAVGSGGATTFDQVADGQLQEGQALQIYPTIATNVFIRYYYDQGMNELKRITSTSATPKTVASGITNTMFFRAENFEGVPLTVREHNFVIRVLVEFFQYTYPITTVGNGSYYDYYKMEFRATRRAHD